MLQTCLVFSAEHAAACFGEGHIESTSLLTMSSPTYHRTGAHLLKYLAATFVGKLFAPEVLLARHQRAWRWGGRQGPAALMLQPSR